MNWSLINSGTIENRLNVLRCVAAWLFIIQCILSRCELTNSLATLLGAPGTRQRTAQGTQKETQLTSLR